MAKKKSSANSKAIPMIGTSLGANVKQPAKTPAGFKGKKAGSAKASIGGKTTLRTTSGNKSSVVNPPRGGGY